MCSRLSVVGIIMLATAAAWADGPTTMPSALFAPQTVYFPANPSGAVAYARRQDRPVLVLVTQWGDRAGQQMLRAHFHAPRVARALKDFVYVNVAADHPLLDTKGLNPELCAVSFYDPVRKTAIGKPLGREWNVDELLDAMRGALQRYGRGRLKSARQTIADADATGLERVEALRLAAKYYDRESLSQIRAILHDPDADAKLRVAAVKAGARIDPVGRVDAPLPHEAVAAAKQPADRRAKHLVIDDLLTLAAARQPKVTNAAIMALADISHEGLESLVDMLGSPRPRDRLRAATVLRGIVDRPNAPEPTFWASAKPAAVAAAQADWRRFVNRRQDHLAQVLPQVLAPGVAAYEPEIRTVFTGGVHDVQATISADRRYITLTLTEDQSRILNIFNFIVTFGPNS